VPSCRRAVVPSCRRAVVPSCRRAHHRTRLVIGDAATARRAASRGPPSRVGECAPQWDTTFPAGRVDAPSNAVSSHFAPNLEEPAHGPPPGPARRPGWALPAGRCSPVHPSLGITGTAPGTRTGTGTETETAAATVVRSARRPAHDAPGCPRTLQGPWVARGGCLGGRPAGHPTVVEYRNAGGPPRTAPRGGARQDPRTGPTRRPGPWSTFPPFGPPAGRCSGATPGTRGYDRGSEAPGAFATNRPQRSATTATGTGALLDVGVELAVRGDPYRVRTPVLHVRILFVAPCQDLVSVVEA